MYSREEIYKDTEQGKDTVDIETMKKKKGIESQRNNGERDI